MLLEVNNVRKVYTTRLSTQSTEALKNVNFAVDNGEYVAIMGESGSGKTTLLNIIATFDKATSGNVNLNNLDLSKLKDKDLANFRRDNLGFVFQDFNLLDNFSIKDNILLPLVLANKKYNIPIVVTGEVDAIAVAGEVITIHNGSSMMPKVIGTGCLLGAVVASFIELDKDNVFKSLETSLLAYNIAGEFAEKRPNGHLPGTYKVEFINSLYEVTDGDISLHKKVKKYV